MKGSWLLVVALVGCGSDITKDAPANSGANAGPGLNSSVGQQGRKEMGSPDSEVIAAYNRMMPLWCAYDATCAEPLFEEGCPSAPVGNMVPEGQCWVVDQSALSTCEAELRGRQCEGIWQNLPLECSTAVRECACLDGFVGAWDDQGNQGCYAPCTNGECTGGLACFDGACMPPQEGRCPDGQVSVFVNDEEGCYDECFDREQPCDDGFVCQGFACIPEAGE